MALDNSVLKGLGYINGCRRDQKKASLNLTNIKNFKDKIT